MVEIKPRSLNCPKESRFDSHRTKNLDSILSIGAGPRPTCKSSRRLKQKPIQTRRSARSHKIELGSPTNQKSADATNQKHPAHDNEQRYANSNCDSSVPPNLWSGTARSIRPQTGAPTAKSKGKPTIPKIAPDQRAQRDHPTRKSDLKKNYDQLNTLWGRFCQIFPFIIILNFPRRFLTNHLALRSTKTREIIQVLQRSPGSYRSAQNQHDHREFPDFEFLID